MAKFKNTEGLRKGVSGLGKLVFGDTSTGEEVPWSDNEADTPPSVDNTSEVVDNTSEVTEVEVVDLDSSDSEDEDLPIPDDIRERRMKIAEGAAVDEELNEKDRAKKAAQKAKQTKQFQMLYAEGIKRRKLRHKWIKEMMVVLNCDWPTAFKHSQRAINKGFLKPITLDKTQQRLCGKLRGNCTFKDVTVEERLVMYDALTAFRGSDSRESE